MERYQICNDQPVILTLSRLSSSEQYKGYDKVIAALPLILEKFPKTIYILAGKYDKNEKQRIESVIRLYSMEAHVKLIGYVPDEEITGHYQLADVFIMPSKKEGFGIVFLEALACGTSVIGGNQDGTVDALQNGSLGTLINPNKTEEIAAALMDHFRHPKGGGKNFQKDVLKQYSFERFKDRLQQHLN